MADLYRTTEGSYHAYTTSAPYSHRNEWTAPGDPDPSENLEGGQTDDQNGDKDGGKFDPEAWGSFIGDTLTGIGSIIGAAQKPGDTYITQTGQGPQEPPKKDNTLLWVIVGIFVLALIIGGFMAFRKK